MNGVIVKSLIVVLLVMLSVTNTYGEQKIREIGNWVRIDSVDPITDDASTSYVLRGNSSHSKSFVAMTIFRHHLDDMIMLTYTWKGHTISTDQDSMIFRFGSNEPIAIPATVDEGNRATIIIDGEYIYPILFELDGLTSEDEFRFVVRVVQKDQLTAIFDVQGIHEIMKELKAFVQFK